MPAEREDFPIARVAALARLTLSRAEETLFRDQLSQILEFVGQVAGSVLDKPSDGGGPARTPLVERPDRVDPSLPPDTALANAPDVAGARRLVRVPKVIG